MFAVRAANNDVPETPAVLKAAEATLSSMKGELTLSVRSKTPLTSAQWIEVELPPGDLETIKAELPKVKVTHTDMTPEAKAKQERAAA